MSGLTNHWRRAWLYALVTLVLLFLILPIFIVIPASFSDSKYLAFPPPGRDDRPEGTRLVR